MMSAPRNALPNGGNGPPSGAPPPRRKKPAANPLVARKKPVAKPPPKPKSKSSNVKPNSKAPQPILQPNLLGVQAPKVDQKTQEEWKQRRRQNGGWWDPPPPAPDLLEFPVVITKKDIKEGLRAHIMRFSKTRTGGSIDVMNDTEFARPVTLHRKDARSVNATQAIKEASASPTPVDPVEAERIAKIKAEKESQRAIDQAQIAPVTKDVTAKKPTQKPERATTQTFYAKRSDEHKKESTIRYEESLPWVLEDADGKSTYVGSYTAALSETMVALQFEPQPPQPGQPGQPGGQQCRLVPLEKFYKFTHKPPFKTYTIEEAERLMNKKIVQGRWAMRQDERNKVKEEMAATRQTLHGRSTVKMESNTFRAAARSEKQEHDDIDFSGDEFQDDDENPMFEKDNDEEIKDVQERVRREQLGANLFGEADEKEIEQELNREEAEEDARKRHGRRLQKALIKREKHMEYKEENEDSSDFGLSSSDDDSDSEKEEVKQEEDSKNPTDQKTGIAPKGASAASGKLKAPADNKKGKGVKRRGSPGLSEVELSGNESSRKRKKPNSAGSVRGSRSSTPLPGSQLAKGAMSDGEATGGEMSDGGRGKKATKKLTVVSGTHSRGTPTGSRAGSPVPASSQMPSGSQSPNHGGASTPNLASGSGPVTAAEIISALAAKPQGQAISSLLSQFRNRVGEGPGLMPRPDWIKLVRQNCKWGPDKLLRPKSS